MSYAVLQENTNDDVAMNIIALYLTRKTNMCGIPTNKDGMK